MRHIEVTDDGSYTVRHPDLGVTYHSTRGAITESKHVFIRHGLLCAAADRKSINVLEIGFGTGLNAFLTFLYAHGHPDQEVHYSGIEKYPLDIDSVRQLNYIHQLNVPEHQDVFIRMHSERKCVEKNFSFDLHISDVCDGIPAGSHYDLVYFDAFAPNAQPEIWDTDVLAAIVDAMRSDGVFVTYCAQGQFKRNLKALGLLVESLPGPPGKREMVRARKV